MFELIFNQSLEDFFYVTMPIFYVIGMVFCFVGIPIIIWFYKRKIPKAARTLIWSGIRREPPLLLCHDSGRGELTTIRERRGEGIVVTQQNKYKILPRWMPKVPLSAFLGGQTTAAAPQGSLPQAPAAEGDVNSEGTEEQEQDTEMPQPPQAPETQRLPSGVEKDLHKVFNIKLLKENFIIDYSDWIVKRTYLVGLDLPFFVGYTGKLCLLNPEALALYEAGEMCIRTEDAVLFNPNKIEGKSIENAFQPLLLLDPRKIQQIIYEGFDQSQIAGIVADSEEIARIRQGISPKMKIFLGILVIVVIAGAALFLLPQILSGFQKQGTPQVTAVLRAIRHLLRM